MGLRPRGTAVSGATRSPEDQKVLRNLGDANVMQRGLSLGSGADGSLAGRFDAVFATKVLAAGDVVVELPHALGRKPGWAKLWETENAAGAVGLSVYSEGKDSWTSSTVRVRLSIASGSLAGVKITLLVGG